MSLPSPHVSGFLIKATFPFQPKKKKKKEREREKEIDFVW